MFTKVFENAAKWAPWVGLAALLAGLYLVVVTEGVGFDVKMNHSVEFSTHDGGKTTTTSTSEAAAIGDSERGTATNVGAIATGEATPTDTETGTNTDASNTTVTGTTKTGTTDAKDATKGGATTGTGEAMPTDTKTGTNTGASNTTATGTPKTGATKTKVTGTTKGRAATGTGEATPTDTKTGTNSGASNTTATGTPKTGTANTKDTGTTKRGAPTGTGDATGSDAKTDTGASASGTTATGTANTKDTCEATNAMPGGRTSLVEREISSTDDLTAASSAPSGIRSAALSVRRRTARSGGAAGITGRGGPAQLATSLATRAIVVRISESATRLARFLFRDSHHFGAMARPQAVEDSSNGKRR